MSMQVVSREVRQPNDISDALDAVLADCDVLLALPQDEIYNRNTIRSILLASYRARKPLAVFAESYVKAGAVAAVFSTPSQLGQQTGNVVNCMIRKGCSELKKKKVELYPDDFSISINRHVARLLGVNLPEQGQLQQNVKEMTSFDE